MEWNPVTSKTASVVNSSPSARASGTFARSSSTRWWMKHVNQESRFYAFVSRKASRRSLCLSSSFTRIRMCLCKKSCRALPARSHGSLTIKGITTVVAVSNVFLSFPEIPFRLIWFDWSEKVEKCLRRRSPVCLSSVWSYDNCRTLPNPHVPDGVVSLSVQWRAGCE